MIRRTFRNSVHPSAPTRSQWRWNAQAVWQWLLPFEPTASVLNYGRRELVGLRLLARKPIAHSWACPGAANDRFHARRPE